MSVVYEILLQVGKRKRLKFPQIERPAVPGTLISYLEDGAEGRGLEG